MKIFIAFFILVAISYQNKVESQLLNHLGKIPHETDAHDTTNVVDQYEEKQPENDEVAMKFMRNIFLHLARHPNDNNIAIVKALIKILIYQKQQEEKTTNFWNLRHG
jgi:hypothetical protein